MMRLDKAVTDKGVAQAAEKQNILTFSDLNQVAYLQTLYDK